MTDILRDIMHVCKMTILCVSPKPRHILLNFTQKDNLISNGATCTCTVLKHHFCYCI